ncbi:glycosyltransferase [Auraticoccus sp. F435]|uniref:Glycosyltransferase n=1 Tax=Auraticoccus cholistanensis TaxID=2656650 RepID=A0A6A9UNU4_9ACTN|nr:glycosyltransferase family 2 protein [Auraticoccus cholistanensis]MVA74536.1 glycosyltransferase [Auraticoccus cholistanensis]
MSIVALLPAHDEERSIESSIRSLRSSASSPHRVVVVCDNCTDRTAEIARACGAEVFLTQDNRARKAGALNQALRAVDFGDDDLLLIMDADTTLGPEFLPTALERLRDPSIGAVGAVFGAGPTTSLLETFQACEWSRYREQLRSTGKVWVLSGTAALIRGKVLRQLSEARGDTVPGVRGDVYRTDALTEDFEITLAIKTLGWKLCSPIRCSTTTETMPTWQDLWRQRLRWYAGAIETLKTYPVSRVTIRYFLQQALLLLGVIGMSLYLLATVLNTALFGFHPHPAWLLLGLVFWAERVGTAWRGSTVRQRFLSALFLPEFCYALFLQAVYLASWYQVLRSRRVEWTHLKEVTA